MSTKIPITIFSGFLGSGKTTLISDLVTGCNDRLFTVLVNEFGSASFDGTVLAEHGHKHVRVVNVTEKLIGYEQDDQFEKTISEAATNAPVDHIVIETSGLAVPTAVAERLMREDLAGRFQLDAIVTVVDVPAVLSGRFNQNNSEHEVFAQQLLCADIVVLNKVDDVSHEDILKAEQCVRQSAPAVRFVEVAHHAHINPKLLLGMHLHEPRGHAAAHAPINVTPGAAAPIQNGHTHSGMDAHEHGLSTHEHLHEHDPAWLSFVLHSHDSQAELKLQNAIKQLAQTEPLLRAKGHIQTADCATVEIQCVRDRVVCTPVKGQHPEAVDESSIVFIGYNLDRHKVTHEMNRLTATTWS